MLMAEKTWKKLTPEQQEAVKKAMLTGIQREREMNEANIQKLLVKLKEEGMEINKVKDPTAFRAKVKPVYEEFRPSIGPELMDKVMSVVGG
jgi:TRAP-type C4-dicarboxylate transport system substrate-binding protein